MSNDITPQEIKRIRHKYQLSQSAFAKVLGLGEASVVRYENGQKPSRANANLIRAADNESFMLECLERDGGRIPKEQLERAKKSAYYDVTFDGEGEIVDMNEIYMLTLDKEILNEKAARMLADVHRYERIAEERGDAEIAMVYKDIAMQIASIKYDITMPDFDSKAGIMELTGKLDGLMTLAETIQKRAA